MRQGVVTISFDDVGPKFDLVFNWPASSAQYGRPTQAQRVAIKRFFALEIEEMKGDEATALLDYRDYSKAAVTLLMPAASSDHTEFMQKCVAAYIGSDELCRDQVSKWADRRFAGSADPATVVAGLRRSKPFNAVAEFVRSLVADIEDLEPRFFEDSYLNEQRAKQR